MAKRKRKAIKPPKSTIDSTACWAKAFLYIHGFLSEAENRKVTQRIIKSGGSK